MTFRARLSVAFVVAALIPLAVLAHGARREVTRRLTEQHERRVAALVDIVREDLARESASIAGRLEILQTDLSSDDRFRLGAVRGDPAHRRHVLDWGERAMEVAGLSMLRIYDEGGSIVSSGHFRNEFGRTDTSLVPRISAASGAHVLTRVKTPTGSFLALVRAHSTSVANRRFTLVGGTIVDSSFFAELGRDGDLEVSLALGAVPSGGARSLERLPIA